MEYNYMAITFTLKFIDYQITMMPNIVDEIKMFIYKIGQDTSSKIGEEKCHISDMFIYCRKAYKHNMSNNFICMNWSYIPYLSSLYS